MAKRFTHRQSLETVGAAIKALTDGKSEAEVLSIASSAVDTMLNSNSMVIADALDNNIAMQNLVEGIQNHLNNPVIQQALPEAMEVIEVLALPEPENDS